MTASCVVNRVSVATSSIFLSICTVTHLSWLFSQIKTLKTNLCWGTIGGITYSLKFLLSVCVGNCSGS